MFDPNHRFRLCADLMHRQCSKNREIPGISDEVNVADAASVIPLSSFRGRGIGGPFAQPLLTERLLADSMVRSTDLRGAHSIVVDFLVKQAAIWVREWV
jgi:hypothetical protein